MTVPFYCVAIALVLLYGSKIPVAMAMKQRPGGYDNRTPRDQQAQLVGWGRRALGGHMNSFEAFAPFAAGVAIAEIGHGDPRWATILAVTHVVARLGYLAAYLADTHLLRSSLWGLAMICSLALVLLPAFS